MLLDYGPLLADEKSIWLENGPRKRLQGLQCLDLLPVIEGRKRSLMLLSFHIWTRVFVFDFSLQSPAPYKDILTLAQYALAQRLLDPVFETKWECRLNHLRSLPGSTSTSITTQMLEYLIASGSLMGLDFRYPLAAFGSSHRLSPAGAGFVSRNRARTEPDSISIRYESLAHSLALICSGSVHGYFPTMSRDYNEENSHLLRDDSVSWGEDGVGFEPAHASTSNFSSASSSAASSPEHSNRLVIRQGGITAQTDS
jgi:hypothetical protein